MELLKGDWFSEKSRIGLGQGWSCRVCGIWVAADQPLVCNCNARPAAPDVDALLAENSRIKELLIELAAAYVGQNGDGAYVGPFGRRLDVVLGGM